MASPRMRAMHTSALLGQVKRLPAQERDDIFVRLGDAARAEIEDALWLAWHPFALHMRLSDAVRAVVGPTRNVDVWRETMAAGFERPLLAGFAKMARLLFSSDVMAFMRHTSRIYEQITRDIGTLAFELVTPDEGMATLTGFPAGDYAFACYIEGTQGCLQSGLDLARAKGDVTVLDVDEARGNVRYRVRR